MRTVFGVGFLLAMLVFAVAIPKEKTSSNEVLDTETDDNFPSYENEESTNEPFMTRIISSIGRIFGGLTQIPNLMARAFSYLVTTQPFSRLREEVRSLNISYPKSILF